jgi:glutamate-1-semialdehyde aminotransferase
MRLFEDVFFSFTFGGEAVSLAACLATIHELERQDGIARMGQAGSRLQAETRRLLSESGLAGILDCVGFPQWTTLRCSLPDPRQTLQLRSLYQQETVKRGILSQGSHMMSVAHDETIIDATLSVYAEVFRTLAVAIESGAIARFLEGPPIVAVFRA